MSGRLLFVLAVTACGRIGFDGASIGDGGGGVDVMDAAALLDPITCPAVRSTIPDSNGVELIVEPAATPMVAWRTTAGTIGAGILDAGGDVTMITTLFANVNDRVNSAYPIASGHALVIESLGVQRLYAIAADLSGGTQRGTGHAGVRGTALTGFGGYVFWGHVDPVQANALLFERLDGNGVPTPQSNRTTSADVRDVVVGGATSSHAHLVWAEADDTCTMSELFGGIPDLIDVTGKSNCRSPRNASGIDDAFSTAYAMPTGALRMYALSGDYDHDIELSPNANHPALADDGNVVWGTWFDDRVGGALVLAKIVLTPTSATVTAARLDGVTPTGPDGVALVGDSTSPRLLVLEAGTIAVVQPCL